jgi:hypothetical protein
MMERKKGTYILNYDSAQYIGRAQAVHVVQAALFSNLEDSKGQRAGFYIADTGVEIPAGTIIAARAGAFFTNIQISTGAVEVIL